MASRIRLIDVTKLKKSLWLVQQQSEAAVKEAQEKIQAQEQFMESVGMDKKVLRTFLNSDLWPASYRHKARQELVRFKDDLKRELSTVVSMKRKEIRLAGRLLSPKSKVKQSARRRRTGFI